MEIAFIYPEMSTDDYVDTIDIFNDDIDRDNLKTSLPRLIVFLINILFYIVYALCVRSAFIKVTTYVTGRDFAVIIYGLFFFVCGSLIAFKMVGVLNRLMRPHLLKLLKGAEAQESYSMAEYVERRDGDKLVRTEVNFYKMCDTLKRSKIVDASAICDGDRCRVEVKYKSHNEDFEIFTFSLPYHESPVLDSVVVDLNRKEVIFPKEGQK